MLPPAWLIIGISQERGLGLREANIESRETTTTDRTEISRAKVGPLMAIETRVQPRQTIQNVAYGVLCLGLGIWGWYDYAVKIPNAEAAFIAYTDAEQSKSELEELARTGTLSDAQREQYKLAESTLALFKEKPAEPAEYDRAVQLWLYIVGCGVLGVPWFAYAQWNLSRLRFRLGDDGSFSAPEGQFSAEQITGIDMSRWMSKSIAEVEAEGGVRIRLDDYQHKGVEDIVAHFAARFEPGKWTSDARPIGDPKSRDTKAQQEAASGQSPESQGSDNAPTA